MIGQLLDGRYQIEKALGKGGFGQTFLAKDIKRPGHPSCIVKKLHSFSDNPESLKVARRLFKKEAEILEKLGEHDCIPTLLADLEENQDFYLVEQFIPGNTLGKEILPGKFWSEVEVVSFLKEIFEVLHFVHSKGVIHRDIKPDNIIRRSSDGKLVLIDFGAVKEIETQLHQEQGKHTIGIGTPGYMPIEQTQGKPQFNSDIYAVGKIAIQALLGLSCSELINLQDPKNPSMGEIIWENKRQVNQQLANIINKMVRFDCRQRYQSVNEVLTDLENIATASKSTRVISNNNDNNFKKTLSSQSQSQSQKSRSLIFAGLAALTVIAGGVGLIWGQSPRIAEHFYQQAANKANKGNTKAAIADLDWAIRFNSQYTQAYMDRGVIRLVLKDYKRATEDFTKVIQINPQNALAYYNRGVAYSQSQQKQQAIADYTQAIQINPKLLTAYYNRGRDRFSMGDNPGAVVDFTKAIDLKPDFAEAYINRCLLYQQLRELNKAVKDCDKAISLNPENFAAYDNRGNVRRELGDYQGAIADFTKGISINPNAIQLYNNRGNVYALGLKDYKKAIEDYNQVIRRDDKSAAGYLNRGATRFKIGDKQGAIADATKAIQLKSDFAQGYLNRGEYRAATGEKQAAIKDFQQAAKLCGERGWTGCHKKSQEFINKLEGD